LYSLDDIRVGGVGSVFPDGHFRCQVFEFDSCGLAIENVEYHPTPFVREQVVPLAFGQFDGGLVRIRDIG
jgi:hypothetical protein